MNRHINSELNSNKIIKELLDEVRRKEGIIQQLNYENEKLKKQNVALKEKILKIGRKPKLTDQEVQMVKMYRIQGLSVRELAKNFNCSIGLISKIINS